MVPTCCELPRRSCSSREWVEGASVNGGDGGITVTPKSKMLRQMSSGIERGWRSSMGGQGGTPDREELCQLRGGWERGAKERVLLDI